jgi:hypothetical protein
MLYSYNYIFEPWHLITFSGTVQGPRLSAYHQGVSLAFLLRIAATCKLYLPEDQTGDLVVHVVYPLTAASECCLLDLLAPDAKGPLDKEQGYFVSQRWASPFLDTVQLLVEHFGMHSEEDSRARNEFLWLVSEQVSRCENKCLSLIFVPVDLRGACVLVQLLWKDM